MHICCLPLLHCARRPHRLLFSESLDTSEALNLELRIRVTYGTLVPLAYIPSSFHLHLLGLVSQMVSWGLCCMGVTCRGAVEKENLLTGVPLVKTWVRRCMLLR